MSKAILKRRQEIERKAIAFLWDGAHAQCLGILPQLLSLSIGAKTKAAEPERYQRDLLSFKTLFNAGEKVYRDALWNMLASPYHKKMRICKKDFTQEEFLFVSEALKATAIPRANMANVNRPIATKRLILRAVERNDFKTFTEHFQNDGDFALYTGYKPTKFMIKLFAEKQAPLYFVIEGKTENRIIGCIGLNMQDDGTGSLEYYIFKDKRRKRYCKEAIGALVEKALTGKLYRPIETIKYGVYRRKSVSFNTIEAKIISENTSSIKVIESCGFIHETSVRGANGSIEEVYRIPTQCLKS